MWREEYNSFTYIAVAPIAEAQLSIPDCNTVGRERQYKFRVRAVNISPNKERLTGPWSDFGEGNCYGDG